MRRSLADTLLDVPDSKKKKKPKLLSQVGRSNYFKGFPAALLVSFPLHHLFN